MTQLVTLMALLLISRAALGDEAAVRRLFEQQLVPGGGRVESVREAPFGDLYEVAVRRPDGIAIYYVDRAASVVIAGQAFEAKSGRNLTEARQRELSKIKWASLPLQWSITMKRGNGRRKIAILSDPNCPFCKRFEEDLAKLDDITVHILPWAVVKPESVRQAKAVWCSKDRVKAWNDLMFRRIEPQAPTDCDNPIEKLIEYGKKLGANSTPTWFLETGERYSGALPLEEVRKLLDEASPAKR
jgi:thiol:disulfide interchange protein DsbC